MLKNGIIIPPPAPRNFVPAGIVQWGIFVAGDPSFLRPHRKPTGVRWQGVKYEAAVQQMLQSKFPHSYLPSPWLKFHGSSGVKWCQPDGLLFDLEAGIVTIVEVKYKHTSDAWWQLRKLYEPVLRKMFEHPQNGFWDFRMLEIVKWYDPLTIYPEETRLLERVEFATNLNLNTTGVHIWAK